MTDMRGRAAAMLGLTYTATVLVVAIWLAPASVHVVGWTDGVATRVALVPPLARLAWLLGAAGVVVIATAIATRGRLDRLTALARIVAPLAFLSVWAVPYLPWLADHLPLLLVLAGPVRWLVAAAAVGWAGTRAVHALLRTGRARERAWPAPGRRAVFIVGLCLIVTTGWHVKRVLGVSGDEPHYLIIAHSLLSDGDLRIENNHERSDYASFYGTVLPMHYLQRGRDGVIYSVHAPGLPALLLPFYAGGGQWGAMLAMALMAALAMVAIFDVSRRVGSRGAALFASCAVAMTVPFVLQGSLIFSEMPAALLVAWTML